MTVSAHGGWRAARGRNALRRDRCGGKRPRDSRGHYAGTLLGGSQDRACRERTSDTLQCAQVSCVCTAGWFPAGEEGTAAEPAEAGGACGEKVKKWQVWQKGKWQN